MEMNNWYHILNVVKRSQQPNFRCKLYRSATPLEQVCLLPLVVGRTTLQCLSRKLKILATSQPSFTTLQTCLNISQKMKPQNPLLPYPNACLPPLYKLLVQFPIWWHVSSWLVFWRLARWSRSWSVGWTRTYKTVRARWGLVSRAPSDG
jgi:hypothetical protein